MPKPKYFTLITQKYFRMLAIISKHDMLFHILPSLHINRIVSHIYRQHWLWARLTPCQQLAIWKFAPFGMLCAPDDIGRRWFELTYAVRGNYVAPIPSRRAREKDGHRQKAQQTSGAGR
jgi:hypothetical protein